LIYLVRHGEAAAGWGDALDPGLSDLGKRQAEATAEKLSAFGAFPALKSPMRRCQETARPFERLCNTQAHTNIAVSEIETPSSLEDRGNWLRGVMSGNWDEASHDFTAWRRSALEAVSALPDGSAVFTHFIAINAIVGLILNDPRVLVFRPGHCSITKLSRGRDGSLGIAELGSEAATNVL